jgi:hypothetical protein
LASGVAAIVVALSLSLELTVSLAVCCETVKSPQLCDPSRLRLG